MGSGDRVWFQATMGVGLSSRTSNPPSPPTDVGVPVAAAGASRPARVKVVNDDQPRAPRNESASAFEAALNFHVSVIQLTTTVLAQDGDRANDASRVTMCRPLVLVLVVFDDPKVDDVDHVKTPLPTTTYRRWYGRKL